MNNERRKRIEKIKDQLIDIQADIDALKEEEEGAYENLPDSLKDGDRGQAMDAAKDSLEEASSDIDIVIGNLDSAME